MDKMITIAEFPAFQAQVGVCITSDERDDLCDYLARNPEAGKEIQGTGGIGKLRWGVILISILDKPPFRDDQLVY